MLQEKLQHASARIGVIGLGYVGLPLALAFAEHFQVIGFDIDTEKIEKLTRGESYISYIPSERIQKKIDTQTFTFTSDFSQLANVDCILICVPTPLTENREPDLSFVEKSCAAITPHLRKEQLVVLESTTYPGTTRNIVLPILEQSGLIAGKDFYLAYSPEREDPGNPQFTTTNIPKVVGGYNTKSLELAASLYARIVPETIPVSSLEVAEACKLLENTYRAVNIALVNELKMLYERMGINIWEVIAAAKTKPFGFQPFYPGPGWGGHCIPIDPFYLTWIAHQHNFATRFIELAGEINIAMPHYVVERLTQALTDAGNTLSGAKITLLGMAYKKNSADPRESPGFELMRLLQERGCQVEYSDPHIPQLPAMRKFPNLNMQSQDLTVNYLNSRTAVIIVTDHAAFDYDFIVQHARMVVDTRNATAQCVNMQAKIIKA